MPSSPCSSSLSGFGEDSDPLWSDMIEQPTLFSYAGIEDQYWSSQSPRYTPKWYTQQDLDEAASILELLRNSGEPLTKLQLARLRYPAVFKMSTFSFQDPEGKNWNFTKMIQREYVNKVGRLLRSVSDNINRALDELDENPSLKISYLESVSLAIQVGEDSNGRSLYVYHGHDFPQSPEILERFITWAESHRVKNSRLFRLANELLDVNSSASNMQLDNEDYPEEVDDSWEEDTSAEG